LGCHAGSAACGGATPFSLNITPEVSPDLALKVQV
jgi:hypothetical protein